MSPNLKAFLDMIAVSEIGAALLAKTDNGYKALFGATLASPTIFRDYRDHPRKFITATIKGRQVTSTAAGRYQILARYFDAYRQRSRLNLPDFSPASQDAIAIQLIRECGALPMIEQGRFADAVHACRSRWASLPGAGYQQHENKLANLQAIYVKAGGTLA